MKELLYYLETHGIEYEAITRSKTFLLCVVAIFVVLAAVFIWALIVREVATNGHVTKLGVAMIAFVLFTMSAVPTAFYAERNTPEKIVIHCTDEQFFKLREIGFKVKLGDNPGEFVWWNYEK